MGARYRCVKAEYSCLKEIQRRPYNFFSPPNGMIFSDKESEIGFNFSELSKRKIIAWKFHVLLIKNLPYDVIIGRGLMK